MGLREDLGEKGEWEKDSPGQGRELRMIECRLGKMGRGGGI